MARAPTLGANVIPQLRRVNKRSWNVVAPARRRRGTGHADCCTRRAGETLMHERSTADTAAGRMTGGGLRQLDRHAADELEHGARCRSLIQNASDVILVVDEVGRITYAAPSLGRVLDYEPADVLGSPLSDLLHEDDFADAGAVLDGLTVSTSEERSVADWRLRHGDGTYLSFEVLSNSLLGDPSVAGIVLTMRDVSERRMVEQQLTHQAFHDSLTGLPNRVLFRDRAEQALARATRLGTLVAIVMIDIDGFKGINDT